jgi:mercuric ion transport protein
MDNRKLIMTGVTGAAVTGLCLGCGATTSASLSAALGVPVSASLLASLGMPSWLGWADYMLRAVTVLFLGLAAYGLYRERKQAIATGKAECGDRRSGIARLSSQARPAGSAIRCDAKGAYPFRET